MRNFIYCFLAFAMASLSCCTDKHLIKNDEYRSKVEAAFKERESLAQNRKDVLLNVFGYDLSLKQEEALKYLYAFMPLSDLADYGGDFFLANVNIALTTKIETPWGKDIPEDVFLHYVLPPRVNNENLDSFRLVYYNEILTRIKGMDASTAALEINHWCHEKVTYQPADIRTSGPMSTILSARGRCGEESTFTVAALRTAGLPARQVYTPRWAHSDDNHAWAEVWIKGIWYYMGACEPEPVLDRGWFTEPARRAMLINTKSFGASYGEENATVSHRNYTEVNNLSKYAVSKQICVKVIDTNNFPVNNAMVEYQLYNYAEFYPLAVVPTDENGISKFETGLGDLLIWARDGDNYSYGKITVNEIDTLILTLDHKPEKEKSQEMDLGVPIARTPFSSLPSDLIALNTKRVNEENKLRQKYIDTWMKPQEAVSLAKRTDTDTTVIKSIIGRSMGNYKTILSFLSKTCDADRSLAISMLDILSDKDLRDIKEEVLFDHLNNVIRYENTGSAFNNKLYIRYILNPRIANEIIVAWRKYLFESLETGFRQDVLSDPAILIKYVNNNIKLADDENYYKTPITPRGVNELKISDSFSRDIYFIAICRSLGIPSRLEPGTNMPQYYFDKKWNDALFPDKKLIITGKGFLRLTSNEKMPVPEYYTHFTIAKFENGRYRTLQFDYNKKVTDFGEELTLFPGHYMMVTGNRISDSRILATMSFFNLRENEHKLIDVKLRKDLSPPEISGNFNLKSIVRLSGNREIIPEDYSEKGIVIIWIEPDKEPTKHIVNDLPHLKAELDEWGGYFLYLTDPAKTGTSIDSETINKLPLNSLIGYDERSEILNNVLGKDSINNIRLPYLILIDQNGNIIFRSEGYKIGIGEQILKKIR